MDSESTLTKSEIPLIDLTEIPLEENEVVELLSPSEDKGDGSQESDSAEESSPTYHKKLVVNFLNPDNGIISKDKILLFVERMCGRRTKHECDICFELFNTVKKVSQHRKTHSPDIPLPYKCKLCPRVFETEKRAKSHHIVCAKTPIKCDLCFERLKNIKFLDLHLLQDHDNAASSRLTSETFKIVESKGKTKYECHICFQQFQSLKKVRVHRVKQHDGIERPSYTCSNCGVVFFHNRQFQVHVADCEPRLPLQDMEKEFLEVCAYTKTLQQFVERINYPKNYKN